MTIYKCDGCKAEISQPPKFRVEDRVYDLCGACQGKVKAALAGASGEPAPQPFLQRQFLGAAGSGLPGLAQS